MHEAIKTQRAKEKTSTYRNNAENNLECVNNEIILNLHFFSRDLNETKSFLGTLNFPP